MQLSIARAIQSNIGMRYLKKKVFSCKLGLLFCHKRIQYSLVVYKISVRPAWSFSIVQKSSKAEMGKKTWVMLSIFLCELKSFQAFVQIPALEVSLLVWCWQEDKQSYSSDGPYFSCLICNQSKNLASSFFPSRCLFFKRKIVLRFWNEALKCKYISIIIIYAIVFRPVIKIPWHYKVFFMFKAGLVLSLVTFGADELFGEVDSQYEYLFLTCLASHRIL